MDWYPEDERKMVRLVMDRKRRLGLPDWISKILSTIVTPGTTTIAPGALPPLAGDVTGSPGSNTVVKVQNIPVSTTDPTIGQVLKFDGSAYTPSADAGGVTDHGALTGLLDDDHGQYQLRTEKGAANGYASLGADTLVPQDQLGTGTQDGTKFLRDDGTWQTVTASALTTRWEPLTNGDWTSPELIFFEGDCVMVEVPL